MSFGDSDFVYSQKSANPKIGKNETEVSAFIFWDDAGSLPYSNARNASGVHFVYRMALKKGMKIGGGALVAADYSSYHIYDRDVVPYGALFADFTQFIFKRQKWSIGNEIGYSFYKREYNYEDTNSKGFNKYTGGLYYSLSIDYRVIVLKKLLVVLSTFYSIRNFRKRSLFENYAQGTIDRYQQTEFHDGVGLRAGVVF